MEYFMGYYFERASEKSDFYNVFIDGEPLVTCTAQMKYKSALEIYNDALYSLREGSVLELVKFERRNFNGYGEVKKSNIKENIKDYKRFEEQCC